MFLGLKYGTAAGYGSLGTLCKPACSFGNIDMGRGDTQLREMWTAHVIAHEVGHNFGMAHDRDIGCGYWPDRGHMSGNSELWSSCSREQVKKIYEVLKKKGQWCLKGKGIFSKTCFKIENILMIEFSIFIVILFLIR